MGDYTNEMLRKDLMDLAKTNIKVPCEIHKVEERDLDHHTTYDTQIVSTGSQPADIIIYNTETDTNDND